MASYLPSIPSLVEFFPPTPRAANLTMGVLRLFVAASIVLWTPLQRFEAMGKTSTKSKFNLPGRYTWATAESFGPIYLVYILMTLPSKLKPVPHSPTSFLGTGLPAQCEILASLYLIHYANRALVSPLYLAPSMSPIHAFVAMSMSIFQFTNSCNIGCWLVYSILTVDLESRPIGSPLSILGLGTFLAGLIGNIRAETTLFDLRRGAAKRKAKSEGKAQVTYDKVYVIPPAEGLFKHVLYPHYVCEWIEWTGFYILGAAWGLGWGLQSPALWFVIVEVATMLPRAVDGRRWYEARFGKRAVGSRAGAIPGLIRL